MKGNTKAFTTVEVSVVSLSQEKFDPEHFLLFQVLLSGFHFQVSDGVYNSQALHWVKRHEASMINDSLESNTSSSVCRHVQLHVSAL